ncbi:MAG TPA: TonB-dependent receptor [Burkholderiales bacterium]|nr:TonB-dependent receptor [Burkholderiales bacterium]
MRLLALLSALFFSIAARGQATDAVTVTGTRTERPSLEVPASVDRVDAEDIRLSRPMVNLSESLNRVPGLSVQNRQNYAQDLQISSRGFGGRSTFGIRGLRLITDGIPASFPDGQGQVSHFDLQSARSIEVLRGPFAVMYGNASGGVINVVTEGGLPPAAEADLAFGSYGLRRLGVTLGGAVAGGDGLASTALFHTDGYRQHSAADRQQANGRLSLPLAEGRLTVVANVFASPAQDPLGLTRAQMASDPRQVAATAIQFNTRKNVAQNQLGAAYDLKLADWTLSLSAYGGHRDVRQYLAIPLATQLAATHSGGVVDLGRDYGGVTARLARDFSLAGRPLTLSFGGEYESFTEARKGFLNQNGDIGSLKRNEDDYASQSGAYAQAEWRFADRWIAVAGVRASDVRFKVSDYFIVPGNADDSGSKRYSATTPSAGLLYELLPATSLYFAAGRGFETPTNTELAYRLTGSGPNFDLRASRSRHLELGVKSVIGERLRLNAAVFDIDTKDEIAIESNSGGRATYKNVGRTNRNGVELGASATLPYGFEALAAWTRLEAKFLDRFTSVANTPAVPVTVAAGSFLPGVPSTMFYGELRWRHAPSGFTGALEYLHKSRVWVDDRNSEAADGYGIVNLAGGFVQQHAGWRFTEYLRVDNVRDRKYAGSVIVNDANLRFYEPAPGRNYVAGVSARYSF